MKKWVIIIAVVIVAVAIFLIVRGNGGGTAFAKFDFAEVTRGDLENVISATGALSAVGTVEVGTQVSGTIDEVYVDYNGTVRRGQVLAVLDTTMLAASVRDARANEQDIVQTIEQEVDGRCHPGEQQPLAVLGIDDDRVVDHVGDRLGLEPDLAHRAGENLVDVGLDREANVLPLLDLTDIALIDERVDLHLPQILGDREERGR